VADKRGEITNGWGVAVGSAADAFFHLCPSGFNVPDKPLRQRRLAGRGALRDICIRKRLRRVSGAVLLQGNQLHRPAPECCCALLTWLKILSELTELLPPLKPRAMYHTAHDSERQGFPPLSARTVKGQNLPLFLSFIAMPLIWCNDAIQIAHAAIPRFMTSALIKRSSISRTFCPTFSGLRAQ